MEPKHRKASWNPVWRTSWRVKVHSLVIYSHYGNHKTIYLSSVNEFKGRSFDVIQTKNMVVHGKSHFSLVVPDDDSPNGGYIICEKLSQIRSRLLLLDSFLLLKN